VPLAARPCDDDTVLVGPVADGVERRLLTCSSALVVAGAHLRRASQPTCPRERPPGCCCLSPFSMRHRFRALEQPRARLSPSPYPLGVEVHSRAYGRRALAAPSAVNAARVRSASNPLGERACGLCRWR